MSLVGAHHLTCRCTMHTTNLWSSTYQAQIPVNVISRSEALLGGGGGGGGGGVHTRCSCLTLVAFLFAAEFESVFYCC